MLMWRVMDALGLGIESMLEIRVDVLIGFLLTHFTQEQALCLLWSKCFSKVLHQCFGERVCIRVA